MQSRGIRLALVVGAAAVAVAAFLVLRPSGDQGEPRPGVGEGEREAAPGAADRGREDVEVTRIEVRGGEPAGGVREIEAERGETVRFVVVGDMPDEVHVHGYELVEEVRPGRPARFEFRADLEGVYEVELHDAGHVPIAELRVSP